MKTTIRKMIWLCFIAIAFVSCSKDEDINPEEPIASCEIIVVSGTIDQPTIWKEGFVYVINGSDLTIKSTLTIEPGVNVKVKDARISVVGGKILAKGRSDKRIVFTSLADDRYCGDTNGDGKATQPAKGDWVEISLNGTTETIFQYVDIFYAGKSSGGNSNAVDISGPNSVSFTFDNCRIAHTFYQNTSYDRSCAFYGSSYMKDATVSKFSNNAFYDNGKPIYFSSFYNLDPSNVFHNPDEPSQKNTYNGIYMNFTGSPSGSTVNWNNTEVPYVLDQYCQVYDPATINIGPNVVVKFQRTTAGLQRAYPHNINLHATAILTSYKDDVNGGDTNGDGNSSSPLKGDWEGLFNYYSGNYHYEQGPNILYAEN